jgi:hypothetical protein
LPNVGEHELDCIVEGAAQRGMTGVDVSSPANATELAQNGIENREF